MDETFTTHLGEMETKSVLKTLTEENTEAQGEERLKWIFTRGCGLNTTG